MLLCINLKVRINFFFFQQFLSWMLSTNTQIHIKCLYNICTCRRLDCPVQNVHAPPVFEIFPKIEQLDLVRIVHNGGALGQSELVWIARIKWNFDFLLLKVVSTFFVINEETFSIFITQTYFTTKFITMSITCSINCK